MDTHINAIGDIRRDFTVTLAAMREHRISTAGAIAELARECAALETAVDAMIDARDTECRTAADAGRYNGWHNYETWRVNLEILGDIEWSEECQPGQFSDTYELSQYLSDYVDDIISDYGTSESLAVDYARSFLSEVNYEEIAAHVARDYPGIMAGNLQCDDCGEFFRDGESEDADCINGDHPAFPDSLGYCRQCAARNE